MLHVAHTRRPKSGTTLHNDYALAHTTATKSEFLASEGVQLMSHPAYSPDLTPCDFFELPHVMKQSRGTRYDRPRTRNELSQGLFSVYIKSRDFKWERAGLSAWPFASKLRESNLKSWHARKASKCNGFSSDTNFQNTPRTCIEKKIN